MWSFKTAAFVWASISCVVSTQSSAASLTVLFVQQHFGVCVCGCVQRKGAGEASVEDGTSPRGKVVSTQHHNYA